MGIEKGYAVKPEIEKCVLVGVDIGSGAWNIDESLDELERLVQTDEAICVGRITQRLDRPYAKTFIGTGKVEELKELAQASGATTIVFDDELTPSQQSNIERMLGSTYKVIDRTALILDIFGQHATTHEGKLQVQMAQLQYVYPRLRGMWAHLAKDKTRGGIGSRFGQGESQLEVDRRLIRDRISLIRKELEKLEQNRSVQRKVRVESQVYRVALAGYTNAGKSTLLNALTGSTVLEQDLLFATLDPTTRSLEVPGTRKFVITDTVGFIQKLPTTLIESFKSTLAEVQEADLILIVADAHDPNCEEELIAVDEVLGEIKANSIPKLVVYNKTDLLDSEDLDALRTRHSNALFISALTGEGLDTLIAAIVGVAASRDKTMTVCLPYAQAHLLDICHQYGDVLETQYTNDGIRVIVIAPPKLAYMLKQYEQGDITNAIKPSPEQQPDQES